MTSIPPRDVVGIGSGQLISLSNSVDVGICELNAFDLVTGEGHTLAAQALGAQMGLSGGSPVVVFGAGPMNGTATEARAIDLVATRRLSLLRALGIRSSLAAPSAAQHSRRRMDGRSLGSETPLPV